MQLLNPRLDRAFSVGGGLVYPLTMTITKGYSPAFDVDVVKGEVGEQLVDTILAQLPGNQIEVKTDYQAQKTGNFYIETHQWKLPDRSDIHPSGISTTEAKYWAFASPEEPMFVLLETDLLREFISDEFRVRPAEQPIANSETSATKGYVVEVAQLLAFGKLTKDPYPKMY